MTITLKLPDHIQPHQVAYLTGAIAGTLLENSAIRHALDACELDPTTNAAYLAAEAAVAVLLAHEIGQGVGQ